MDVPLVKVKQGPLKGISIENDFGGFISFNGIPYAEPPTGKLRFKDPQPPKSWNGIREAINEGGQAAQISFFTHQFTGGDDCLYLNVSTKNLVGKKPVMVWIHGGGFTVGSGSAEMYRGDYLIQHDIVFVSINYRVGTLGFLNMDIENCSGNQGLKDQVLALKWVQENIEAFGGDKDNVTIFGESAGSASVHYLCISPLAKGLFHKAIMQSGVSINPWAFQFSNKEFGIKIADELGYSSSDSKDVVEFLQTIPAEKIIEIQTKSTHLRGLEMLKFPVSPTVDNKSLNPFLPRPLSEMIKNGIDVPVIIGYNSHEGLILVSGISEETLKDFDENFEKYLASDLKLDLKSVHELSTSVRNFYFKGNPITMQEQDGFVQYEGDVMFVNGIQHVIEKQFEKKTPTFFYKYSYTTEESFLKKAFKINAKGACHGDDLTSLFYMTSLGSDNSLKSGTTEYLLMQRMTKIWTDFAKTGDPTPQINEVVNVKWIPNTSNRRNCFHINENLSMEENFEEESWKLWKPALNKYCTYM